VVKKLLQRHSDVLSFSPRAKLKMASIATKRLQKGM